jgi:hypothetical protein
LDAPKRTECKIRVIDYFINNNLGIQDLAYQESSPGFLSGSIGEPLAYAQVGNSADTRTRGTDGGTWKMSELFTVNATVHSAVYVFYFGNVTAPNEPNVASSVSVKISCESQMGVKLLGIGTESLEILEGTAHSQAGVSQKAVLASTVLVDAEGQHTFHSSLVTFKLSSFITMVYEGGLFVLKHPSGTETIPLLGTNEFELGDFAGAYSYTLSDARLTGPFIAILIGFEPPKIATAPLTPLPGIA